MDNRDKSRTQSRIADWHTFVAWAAASELFPDAALRKLRTRAERDAGPETLSAVHRLREAAHAVLRKRAACAEPSRRELGRLEAVIKTALDRARLTRRGPAYAWWPEPGRSGWVVDTLALSVENLLRTGVLERLRECGRCSWLFIDHGRGKGRRWCDMRTCGNRAKAGAFRML